MCWLFTTINTEESDTKLFSGHRHFGIHQDEEGYYPYLQECLIEYGLPQQHTVLIYSTRMIDYFTIANNTWNTYMKKVLDFIIKLGGTGKIMPPEVIRTKFADFDKNFTTSPTLQIGNIPQEKIYDK